MQPAPKPRFLDLVRAEIRKRHYSYRTEKQYVGWIVRFIQFHDGQHPRALGGPEVEAFLSDLATTKNVAAATQAQALAAVLFDMGFPAPFGKLVFIIGRVAGLTAEVAEEYAREKAMRIRIPVTYDGPPPREIE